MKNLATLGMLLLVVAGSAQYVVVQQTVTTTTTTYPGNVQTAYYQTYNSPCSNATYTNVPPGYFNDPWGNYIPETQIAPVVTCQPVLQTQIHPVVRPTCTGAADFGMMLHEISRQHFDSSRLLLAKQIISSNRLSSAQINKIMRVFSFESSRLEIAKFAYNYVVDPQRYFMVNNAFSFSSSVDDLNRYIGQIW